MFSHLHSTAVAVNEAKCREGISAALLFNCAALLRSFKAALTRSGPQPLRAEAARLCAMLGLKHSMSTFQSAPFMGLGPRRLGDVAGGGVASESSSVHSGNTKGCRTKEPLHPPSISFRNRSETAASNFLHSCNLAASYSTKGLVGITRGNCSKGRDLLKTH